LTVADNPHELPHELPHKLTRALPRQSPGDLLTRFRNQARRHPVAFVGGALGAGLLAGGAIAPRVLGRLAALAGALAWRTVVLPMIKDRVFAALEPRSDEHVETQAAWPPESHRGRPGTL
jgi:hypothetical protein